MWSFSGISGVQVESTWSFYGSVGECKIQSIDCVCGYMRQIQGGRCCPPSRVHCCCPPRPPFIVLHNHRHCPPPPLSSSSLPSLTLSHASSPLLPSSSPSLGFSAYRQKNPRCFQNGYPMGMGTVVDFGTLWHTAYLYHGIVGMYEYIIVE